MKPLLAWIFAAVALTSLIDAASAAETVSRASDGDVELVVQVDRTTAHVVEPIELTLTLTAPPGTKVTLPQPGTNLGAFQVVGVNTTADIPDRFRADRRTWTAKISLDTLESGVATIPPLDVQYRVPDSNDFRSLSSDPIEIQIDSLLEDRVDPTDFRDIKPVVDVVPPAAESQAWIVWVASATGLIFAAATCVLFVARRRKVVSPGDWTLTQIAQLESTIDAEPATTDSVYGELTRLLQDFVGMQFGHEYLPSSDATRFDRPEDDSRVPPSLRQGLQEILSLADEVKFAKRPVSEAQVRQSLEQAREWVRACVQDVSLLTQEAA